MIDKGVTEGQGVSIVVRSSECEVRGAELGVDRGELVEALRAEKNQYYRVTVGRMLVELNDTALARSVASDDFRAYPKQLFYLAYMIARIDPIAARPLLMQMLTLSKGSVYLPQHFMKMNWSQLLLQAFGVAEPAVIDDLVRAAESSDSAVSAHATRLLGLFGEPRLVGVLRKKIDAAQSPDERRRLIDLLSTINLPETVDALKTLEARGGTSSEMLAVRVSVKALKPPTGEMLPDRKGTVITDPAIKSIFFRSLEDGYGRDVSFVEKTIALSATKEDIPQLQRLRSRILFRLSDEAAYDWKSVSAIIARARWEGRNDER